jgi:hypothetical protein
MLNFVPSAVVPCGGTVRVLLMRNHVVVHKIHWKTADGLVLNINFAEWAVT